MPEPRPGGCHLVGGEIVVRLPDDATDLAAQLRRELGAVPVAGLDPTLPLLDVRVGPRLAVSGRLRVLGVTDGAFAFDDSTFYLVERDGRRLAIDIPGPDCIRLRAEPGTRRLPLLPALVGLLLLGRGRVLLHAAAVRVGDVGVLIPGWQSGGKSELVLGLAAGDARTRGTPVTYASDEWTVVGREDGCVTGLPTPVQLWDWQLGQLPAVAAGMSGAERRRLRLLRMLRAVVRIGVGAGRRLRLEHPAEARGAPLRALVSLDAWLAHVQRTAVQPESLGMTTTHAPLPVSAIVLPVVSDGPGWIRTIDSAEVATRMLGSQAFERRDLEAVHARFRYAFPGRRWAALDAAPALEARILRQALAGVPAVEAAHPYPVDLVRFGDRVATALSRVARPSVAGGPGAASSRPSVSAPD